ncbi:MAG: ThiF family adenylyltransferase [Bacteroidales bacterium]
MEQLTNREIKRYEKHIMLPEIGIEGQIKIRNSSVAVVGAGGLGCPVLQYLTAAGVGKIGIVEYDMVDESNLQRQILYGSADKGKLKSIISRDRLNLMNDQVEITLFNIRLDNKNSEKILQGYDIIVDATDNYSTRYIISDASVKLDRPMVHGAIYKFEGQVSVFNYMNGPSYRCYNPEPELKKGDPAPSETGLLGVLPGITGTYMATEVLKIITGTGNVLSGRVLVFNILKNTSYTIEISRNPDNFLITG